MKPRLARALLVLAWVLAACGDRTADAEKSAVLVLAAADLQGALGEIAAQFEEETGQTVRLVFGSTGNLTTQIENGAPADLFFAANESFMDRLAAAGLVEDGTRRIYALGRLALVARSGTVPPPDLGSLASPRFGTIAIANPEHAPYGTAAREALRRAGVWSRVQPRLVLGENVAQTYQFVRTGNADAGIVALALVEGSADAEHVLIPDSLHAPLRQAAGAIRGSPRAPAARRFLDFVTGSEGQAILRRYGFVPPRS